jgi:membrane-bound metal-dependent hydrolase YbcI (DUF457 family)
LALLQPIFLPFIFFITVLASFLPDLDSDGGTPLRILLTTVSIISGVYVGYFSLQNSPDNGMMTALLYGGGYALFVYYIIGGIFKKITVHRGIFHSIPAAVLSSLVTLSILNIYIDSVDLKLLFSISVGIGYLCHLVLDELNSAVNLGGMPFVPNKSLGTALKFVSKNKVLNIIIYGLILLLIYYQKEYLIILIV